ncbi:hypothetical protein TSAR_016278 [Trichomalopsis sarcophagae]|uniref:Ras-related protein Rab-23 n=2 Tax=Apocrita TaxID=7400 RepID=A0A232EWF1_9HYME|nr:hypothetical protein TSAR_016278 [Trichomalopsis sarcophagae]
MREEELEISLKVVIVGNGAVGKSSMIQRFCKGTYTRDYKKTIGVDFLEREIEVDGEDVRLMLWDTAGQEEFDAITAAYYRGAHACVLAFSATDRDSFDAIPSWKLKWIMLFLLAVTFTLSCAQNSTRSNPRDKFPFLRNNAIIKVGRRCPSGKRMVQGVCRQVFCRTLLLILGLGFLLVLTTAARPQDIHKQDIIKGNPRCPQGYRLVGNTCRKIVENECGEIPTVLVQNKMDLIDQCVIDPDEAERLGRALGCKLLRTSVKEDVGVMSVFRHLASRCLYEMRRYEEEEDFRIYSCGPRSPSVISAFSPNGSTGGRNLGNGTIVLRATGKMRHHKKKNFVKNACRLL